MTEQGFFAPLGGSSSSSKWAGGKGDVVYSLDYDRGIDIIRWKGSHYVPTKDGKGIVAEPGRASGTNGPSPLAQLTSAQAAKADWLSNQLAAEGWAPWYCLAAAEHTI